MNNLCLKGETVRAVSGSVMMRVSFYDGEELVEQTNMSIDDYISLLQGAHKKEALPAHVTLGKIPMGLYDGFKATEPGTLGGIFYIPPQKHQFILADSGARKRKAYYLPMPGLVFSVIFNKGHKQLMRCFAFKKWEDDETVLYKYPFGNVANDGSVCMGSISPKGKMTDFCHLREYIEDSMLGVTNGDYLTDGKVRLACDMTQHEFCDSIEENEEFPFEILLNTTKPVNVGELKKDFFKYVS